MQPVQNNKLVFICYQLHKTNSKVQKKVIPARKEFAQIQEKFEYIQESAVIKSTNKKQIKKEFTLQPFKRSFTLDERVISDNIAAKYENGLLTLSIPKKEEVKVEAKQIAVN